MKKVKIKTDKFEITVDSASAKKYKGIARPNEALTVKTIEMNKTNRYLGLSWDDFYKKTVY